MLKLWSHAFRGYNRCPACKFWNSIYLYDHIVFFSSVLSISPLEAMCAFFQHYGGIYKQKKILSWVTRTAGHAERCTRESATRISSARKVCEPDHPLVPSTSFFLFVGALGIFEGTSLPFLFNIHVLTCCPQSGIDIWKSSVSVSGQD